MNWIDDRGRAREDHKSAWIFRQLQHSDNPEYWLSELFDLKEDLRWWRKQCGFLLGLVVVISLCWWRFG